MAIRCSSRVPASISVNPALNPSLSYTAKDLIAVTKMTTSPLVLAVNPATGIRSVPDLIAAAKKDPGKLNYSTSGNGSAPHLGAALFCQLTGTQMTHIPYRGGSLAIQSVMAGRHATDLRHIAIGAAAGQRGQALCARRQYARALAAGSGPPGMKEAGLPDYDLEFWYGMFVPAGTSPSHRQGRSTTHRAAAMQQPAVKAALAREGTGSIALTRRAVQRVSRRRRQVLVNLAKSANVKLGVIRRAWGLPDRLWRNAMERTIMDV